MKAIIISLFFVISTGFVQADTLKIVGTQGDKSIEVPTEGQHKQQVIKQFGEPTSKSTPVGKPVITVWVYNGYRVVFEGDAVLDIVLDK